MKPNSNERYKYAKYKQYAKKLKVKFRKVNKKEIFKENYKHVVKFYEEEEDGLFKKIN